MCGLAGLFRPGGELSAAELRSLRRAGATLGHRGPDDSGLYVSPDRACALDHRRLSILDLSPAGRQPLADEEREVWIVFNGEIYNFAGLKDELRDRGHRFRSSTDTEVILHLYEEEGEDLVRRLDGMFAFVLYDSRRRTLIGARDRMGVKPLYLARGDGRIAFASEAGALLSVDGVSRTPSREALSDYLAFNSTPGPRTLFRDIEKLPPGTRFRIGEDGVFHSERYWWPGEGADRKAADRESLTDLLDERLLRATEKRMISDVPFGAMLSGGVDSSLNVALMSESLDRPVKTFTIGYPGDDSDPDSDLLAARRVAEAFGTDHHERVVTSRDILTTLEELPSLADDPIGAPSVTANLLAAGFARRSGVKVVQVGEGADELFCGYGAVQRLWKLRRRLGLLAWILTRRTAGTLARGGEPLFRLLGDPSLTGALDGTVREQLRRYARSEQVHWGHGVLFSRSEQERLFRDGAPPSDPYAPLRQRLEELPGFAGHEFLDRLTLIDLVVGLPERLLMRVDRATMRHGLEARVPFLDPGVIEAAFRAPAEWRASRPKELLKSYARRRLPDDIVDRPKAGFPTAREIFMGPEVLPRIRASVTDRRFLEFTRFDRERLETFFAAAEEGDHRFFYHLWSLYVLSLWHRVWVEGGGAGP